MEGIVLQLSLPVGGVNAVFSQVQLRGKMPLQTTLLNLAQASAMWLRSLKQLPADVLEGLNVDIVLLTDPAVHGTVRSYSTVGIEPAHRAVMVTETGRMGWEFNRDATPEELVAAAAERANSTMPRVAQVVSFAASSSAAQIGNSNIPPAVKGPAVRPSAVAGKFYPGSEPALAAIVKKCLGEVPSKKTEWPAVMVPHAGLQYSGEIAGDVLKQVQLPKTVIIIGPKHSRNGVEWAVAPHETWQIPGGELKSDLAFAKQLAERIEGLELDAGAHENEHSIEVELPLLHALAPETKVIGIAIGGGNFERCQKFGQQLALFLSELDELPLLVISSDMNHFASDAENRELDEIALKAMESLDPKTLFESVRGRNISMCGLLPAVIVMEALLSLDRLDEIQRVRYGTSGDVSGNLDRVVGYAGLLLG